MEKIKKHQTTKKHLTTSIVALGLSMAMLAGTTLAWFTDSITTSANIIKTGELKISAEVHDASPEGTLNYDIKDKGLQYDSVKFTSDSAIELTNTSTQAILEEQNWEPGMTGAKLITVKNTGTLAAKVNLVFNDTTDYDSTKAKLVDVLWFDIVKVVEGKVDGSIQKLTFNQLLAKQADVTQELSAVNTEKSASFIFFYGMNEDADNTYQDTSFNMDIGIKATQHAEENDAFGKNYDANAYNNVATTAQELIDALEAAGENETVVIDGTIKLTSTLSISKSVNLIGGTNAVVTGAPVYVNVGDVSIKNITFDTPTTGRSENSAIVATPGNGKLTIQGCTFRDVPFDAIQITKDITGAEITIDGCTFETTEAIKDIAMTAYENHPGINGERAYRYIHIEPQVKMNSGKIVITNNTFSDFARIADSPIAIDCRDNYSAITPEMIYVANNKLGANSPLYRYPTNGIAAITHYPNRMTVSLLSKNCTNVFEAFFDKVYDESSETYVDANREFHSQLLTISDKVAKINAATQK